MFIGKTEWKKDESLCKLSVSSQTRISVIFSIEVHIDKHVIFMAMRTCQSKHLLSAKTFKHDCTTKVKNKGPQSFYFEREIV